MTAARIVDDHLELANVGTLTHPQVDALLTGSMFLLVSGSGPMPDLARRLKAGPGVTITDEGPGGHLIISAASALTGSATSWMEEPSGDVDGDNATFVLANAPLPTQALMFFINGALQKQGTGNDYLLSGSTVTVSYAPRSGSNVAATYPY